MARISTAEPTNRSPRFSSPAKLLPPRGLEREDLKKEVEALHVEVRAVKLVLEVMMMSYAKQTPNTVMPCSLLRREREERAMVRPNQPPEVRDEEREEEEEEEGWRLGTTCW